MATGSLVCGILGLLAGLFGFTFISLPFAFILGIVAVVLGILGLRKVREVMTGRGQSITGIITGSVGLAAMLLWSMFWIVFGPEVRQQWEAIQEELDAGQLQELQ